MIDAPSPLFSIAARGDSDRFTLPVSGRITFWCLLDAPFLPVLFSIAGVIPIDPRFLHRARCSPSVA
jgi:hypothetical protein